MTLHTALLVVAFNRPGPARALLDLLKTVQPRRLYVALDGPRPHRPGEAALCQQVEDLFRRGIDWPCDTRWLVRRSNLGCRRAVSGALDWLFEHETEGIILEDDVLPIPDFFPYCEALLERYRHDTRIGMISGNCHWQGAPPEAASYGFSIYARIWGWATWRRAWAAYQPALEQWPAFNRGSWLEDLGGAAFARRWRVLIDQVACGEVDTWDLIWQLACWQQGYLTCMPAREQVVNVGFGADATHTQGDRSPLQPAAALPWPLRHPQTILPSRREDQRFFEHHIRSSWWRSVRRRLLQRWRQLHWPQPAGG